MADWFVETSRDRFRLVLEDLRELPAAPAVVVEGPQLFPGFLAPLNPSPAQSLFLVPPRELQRERLAARGSFSLTSDPERARANASERNVLIAERIALEARELGLPLVEVDRPLAGMIELAAAHFAPFVRRGGDRFPMRRRENEAMLTQVKLYRASGEAPPGEEAPLAFACECDRRGCDRTVELRVADFDELVVTGGRVNAHA
jgi:hypothetical protein